MDVEKFNNHLKVAPWNVMDTFDKLEYWKSLTLINSIAEKHMPTKKMRFRKVDVPYMTIEWKKAIKPKRPYARQYANNRTEENCELKRKWKNEATKFRRRAMRGSCNILVVVEASSAYKYIPDKMTFTRAKI